LKRLSLFLCAALIAGVPAHAAEPQKMSARVTVTFLGLPVARADVAGSFGAGAFSLDGSFASAGLARMFDRTQGTASVSGQIGAPRVKPAAYDLAYRTKKDHSTSMRFSRDRLVEHRNLPEPPPRNKEWVPLDKKDLSGVNDPISAMMIPAASAAEICNRDIRVFDGEFRVDIGLRPSERRLGGEVTCRISFTPVSGYRSTRSAIKFLRDRSRILIAFARIGDSGLYGPVEASIGTQIGSVHVRATDIRFSR
jgi:hypothetical protein